MRALPFGLALLLAAAPSARAHHGKDFLIVETEETPHPRQAFLLFNQGLVRAGGENACYASPAVLVGLSSRVAVEVHGHLEKAAHEDWSWEAVAPSLRIRLGEVGPLRLALSGEYEIGHGHASDHLEGRAILAYRRGVNVTVDAVVGRSRQPHATTQVGYAVGVRPAGEHAVVVGLEAQGTLRGETGHEVLAGLYLAPRERVTVKLGIGRGFGRPAPTSPCGRGS